MESSSSGAVVSGSVLFSQRERDASYASGSPTLTPFSSPSLLASLQKLFKIKTLFAAQHVVDASSKLGGENRESLALAVLRLESTGHLLSFLAVAQGAVVDVAQRVLLDL